MFELFSTITSWIASIATAVGVIVAARQLWLTREQSRTSFEDSLSKEYREIAATLPTKALLGDPLTDEEHAEYFDEFYRYLDLCNEQAFLHETGRISEDTWTLWKDGIVTNLERPAFRRAWREIAVRANKDFSELRKLSPPQDH